MDPRCDFPPLQSLVTDMEEAEAQHARALGSHLQNVDRLLQLQRCRLACLEEGFDAQLKALEAEFETERYREGEGDSSGTCWVSCWVLSPLPARSRQLRLLLARPRLCPVLLSAVPR